MKPLFNNINSDEQIKIADITFNAEGRDYSNDPTFLKRAQEAKEFMERVGFPEDLLKIRDAMYGPEEKKYDFEVRSYPMSSASIKAAEEAKKFLEAHPIPLELLEMVKPQNGKK